MFGRCIRAFLPFLLLATTAPAQNQKLSLVKSFNLSPDIAGKLSISTKNEIWCGAHGDLLLPIEHGRFMDQRLVKVSSTGKVLARINVDSVPGFAKSNVVEFGLAPSGNVYVLAARVTFERVDRRKKGEVTGWSQTLEKDTWVLVFNGDGNFHSIARLSMPLYVTAMAPLGPSNLLVVLLEFPWSALTIEFLP